MITKNDLINRIISRSNSYKNSVGALWRKTKKELKGIYMSLNKEEKYIYNIQRDILDGPIIVVVPKENSYIVANGPVELITEVTGKNGINIRDVQVNICSSVWPDNTVLDKMAEDYLIEKCMGVLSKKTYKENIGLKIVEVQHLNFDGTPKNAEYFFKSSDQLAIGDIVECDTKYGVSLGKVKHVFNTLEQLITEVKMMSINFDGLKECRKREKNDKNNN